MAKKIDIAGELNAATTKGILGEAKQINYAEESKSVEQKLKELSDEHKDYEDLGQYTDSPEFIRVYTDVDGKFLWGIRADGTVEWAKGVPTPVKEALRELESKINTDNNSKFEEIETSLVALQDAVDVINASLKPLTDTFSFQDSPEFVNVVTDADGKVLFGLTAEGKPYFPKNTMYSVESNQEFLAAWLDSAGHVLFGLRTDGSTYVAKADFLTKIEEITKLLDENSIKDEEIAAQVKQLQDTFSIVRNDEWLHAVVDAEGKLLFGIKAENGEVVMPKQDTYKVIRNDEWLAAWLDSQDRILFGVKADGTFWAAKSNFAGGGNYDEQIAQLNEEIQQLKDQIQATASDVFSVIDDAEERLAITTDKDERVISYRDKDGVLHENVGLSTKKLTLTDEGMIAFKQALKDSGFNPTTPIDWSDKIYIHIPTKPKCAMINITGIEDMPTSKTDDLKAYMEVWDNNGNYFKKKVILNAQGDSTMINIKKNFAADFCEDEWEGDDTTTIKIGDWVSQDSFHFKAYYTDMFKFACPVGYEIFDEFVKTRDFCSSRPYMEYYEGDYSTNSDVTDDIEQNMEYSVRCYPDSFPVMVYLNGEFYGIFSWQLKKDRDNFHFDRNATDNIHLDGYLGGNNIWEGAVTWDRFEVRNPKPKSSKWTLLCQDGSEYDGDNPKELMGTDSDFYDGEDDNCIKSAETKANIEALSKYMAEIKVFEDVYTSAEEGEQDTALATLKTEIEKRFSIDWMIDYILLAVIMQNGDTVAKNWQWVTWGKIDSKMKWFAMPYDLDQGFGVSAFKFGTPTKYTIGQGTNTPARYVWDYYLDDMKARYAELRKADAISYEKIFGFVLDWAKAIGFDNYELEYDKWDESPCNRDNKINDGWEYTNNQYLTYNDLANNFSLATTYAKGDHIKVNRVCYESLQDNNKGNDPLEEGSIWWKNVSPQAGVTYNIGDTVYDGYSNFYRFRATEQITIDEDLSNRPFKKFYDGYPHEGGVHDSIYRISKWIKEKIRLTDEQFEYNV